MEASGPLIEAARRGEADEVARILDAEPALVNAKSNGVSVLLLALYSGHPDVSRIFVERGALLDVFDAAALGEVFRLEEVLRVDPSLADAVAADGFTPLGLAAFFRRRTAVRILVGRGAKVDRQSENAQHVAPIISAVAGGDADVVRELLDAGADVGSRQEGGYMALHSAAAGGDEAIVRLLLEYGADPAARTEAGQTAQDIARDRGKTRAAELLASAAAPPTLR
jgi:ankyrin repeat protein